MNMHDKVPSRISGEKFNQEMLLYRGMMCSINHELQYGAEHTCLLFFYSGTKKSTDTKK